MEFSEYPSVILSICSICAFIWISTRAELYIMSCVYSFMSVRFHRKQYIAHEMSNI